MKRHLKYTLFFISFANLTFSQNTRISNHNSIGWYNYFGTFKLNSKWGIHTEYQWRRENTIVDWQQSLLRLGLNYQLNSKVQLRSGYGWIETFPYGELAINGFGRDFSEHRVFEMASITDKVSVVDLLHRFMFEQRFVGRYSNANLSTEDGFPLLNRFRYMFRCQLPLKGKEVKDNTPYVALYDEIFLGFGKNVNENVFDQNRFGILFGCRFDAVVRIEVGYLNQILQLGRELNGRNAFQYNNGIIFNTNFNIDLSSKN